MSRKPLEGFLAERIVAGAPPLLEDVPPSLQEEVRGLTDLSDDQLWDVARSRLPAGQQGVYTRLLNKNSDGAITGRERERMHALGDEARRITLRKAQAYALLSWRGYRIPTREELLRGG